MLKYSDRITKLTDGQKIRILAELGELSGKDMKNLGIPSMKAGNMKDYGRSRYPHTHRGTPIFTPTSTFR